MLPDEEWKRTPAGAVACARVAAYLEKCLHLFEQGGLEQGEEFLARNRWRDGADLSVVPERTQAYTEALIAKARGLAEYGDPEAIGDVLRRSLDLWQ